MLRYHGVLAPAAKWRSQVVPRPRYYTWAQLLRRVFRIDVLECPRCGDRLRILAAIQSPEAIQKILNCLDLPARAPPIAAAAPEDNPHLEWA